MRLKAAVRIAILDVCTATIRDSMDDNRDDDCCVRWGRGARAGSRASNGSIWQRFPSSSAASSSLVISTWEKKRKLKGSQKTRTLSRQTALMTDSLGAPPTDGRQKFFQIARASRAPRSPAGSWPISMLSQMMDICTRDATLCSFRLTCRFVFVSRQTPLISAFRWINNLSADVVDLGHPCGNHCFFTLTGQRCTFVSVSSVRMHRSMFRVRVT